jgi:hypothetical protein
MKKISVNLKVSFPEFSADNIIAKVDTGAYSGCFHATNISLINTSGADILEFSPFDHPEIRYKTIHFSKKHVKSSNGHIEERFFIDTDIVLNDEKYPIRLSLADRSGMKFPVLIGRKFLKKNRFLVDVNA